ncbi:MAG: hypothetical protein LKG54_10405 [Lactobacillus crispatus]|nr:hypothetical protein [Lactobacillus crispatus]
MRNTRLNKNYRDNLGHQIENIVFIELLHKGYNTVLSLSQFDEGTVDGIAVKYLIDWLLEE